MTLTKDTQQEMPGTIGTLIEMLEHRAIYTPKGEAFRFKDQPTSYADLWRETNQVGTFLRSQGVAEGDRVVIIFPNGPEFFSAFYGIQRAGGVSVPIFPGSGDARVLSIFASCAAKAIIVPSDTPDETVEKYRDALRVFGAELYRFNDCRTDASTADLPVPEPDDVAFLQYTSGSTGNSKGVMLTHRNLVANLRQMVAATQMTEDDVLVSWLPVYHDLGLIFMTMSPFYVGARLILLPTSLLRMTAWLEAITQHKGTITAAPDIGFRQVVRQVRDPSKYDLTSLRVAISAAEPVRFDTVQSFEKMFGVENVIKPSYGLAEACVGVSFWGLAPRPIKVDANGNVAIGGPLQDIELIVAGETQEAATGEVGELVFKSPSGTQGYFRNPDATDVLCWGDRYIRTGDLAYRDNDGDIFMIARKKNIIKQSGRTIAPREIEELVEGFAEIRNCAAVGISRGDAVGEQAYVFAELRFPADSGKVDAPKLARSIVRTIHDQLGFRPGRVYLVKKQTVPYTYNGKIRHAELKQQYLDGALAAEGKIVYPKARANA